MSKDWKSATNQSIKDYHHHHFFLPNHFGKFSPKKKPDSSGFRENFLEKKIDEHSKKRSKRNTFII